MMTSASYCCQPNKDAMRIETTLTNVKNQIHAFQSLNIKKSYVDYEILLNRLEDILKSDLTKLQESRKKKINDDDDGEQLTLQCRYRCPTIKFELGEKLQQIQNKIDQFKTQRKSKQKTGGPTVLKEINEIIQKDIAIKSSLSPNPDENMKPEEQSQNDEESIAVKKEESLPNQIIPINIRRSKRSSSVLNVENNKTPTKKSKTLNEVKKEKEDSKISFKQEKEHEHDSTDSSQNNTTNASPSNTPKREHKLRDFSVRVKRLGSEEVERVTKKPNKKPKSNPNNNKNSNSDINSSTKGQNGTSSKVQMDQIMKDSKIKGDTQTTSNNNKNSNKDSSTPPPSKQKQDDLKPAPTSTPTNKNKDNDAEDDDDCVLLFTKSSPSPIKYNTPKPNLTSAKTNNNNNDDDDDVCVIECDKSKTFSPQKSTTKTTTTASSASSFTSTTPNPNRIRTVGAGMRAPIRYKYDDLFSSPLDEYSFIHDYLAVDRNALFSSNFSKYYIRFYDDRMLSMDGKFLMLLQHQSQSDNKPPEKNIYQHKLKVIKAKIMKEQEEERQQQQQVTTTRQTPASSSSSSSIENSTSPDSSSSSNTSKRITVGLDVRDVNLFLREPQDFLEFFKNIITHLSFGRRLYSGRLITENTLFHLLTCQLNKLEYLAIEDEMLMPWNERLFFSPIPKYPCLTSLKVLRLSQTKRTIFTWKFISNLLKQAPNLTKIYGLSSMHIAAVEQSSHEGRILKSVCGIYRLSCEGLTQYSQKLLFQLSQLTGMKSQGLEILDIRGLSNIDANASSGDSLKDDESNSKTVKLYTELIKYNRNSVKRLKLRPMTNLSFIKSFEFPRTPYLETLQLFFENKDIKTRFFPKNWVLIQIFPRVKNVEIKFSKEFKNKREDSSSSATTTTTTTTTATTTKATISPEVFPLSANLKAMTQQITNLKINGLDSGLEQLSPVFLNISKLTIVANCTMLKENLRSVFSSWPRLKCLQIELEMSSGVCCLDSVITGMDKHVLQNLRESGDKLKLLNINSLDTYRKHPSLTDLKDLRLFKIVFTSGLKNKHQHDTQGNVLFSRAAAQFGFDKSIMPQLDVIIKFNSNLTTADRRDIFGLLEPVRTFTFIDV